MVVQHHPHVSPGSTQSRADLRLVEPRRRRAKLHLLTYLAGNAFFWVLWGAISVSADDWYWWPVVPLAGWTLVLALHVWHAFRS
jgi:hypothetical protein